MAQCVKLLLATLFSLIIASTGSGNWPCDATGNPTLTISALALWAADTIAKQLTQ